MQISLKNVLFRNIYIGYAKQFIVEIVRKKSYH